MRTSAPFALACSRLFFRSGHAHRVSERSEDHAGHVGQGHAVVNAPHRQHTNGTARAVNQLDPIRQHRLDTVSKDGVGVASAYFHDVNRIVAVTCIWICGTSARISFSRNCAFSGIAEFVDVFHLSSFFVRVVKRSSHGG
jgi:hypothetical protein